MSSVCLSSLKFFMSRCHAQPHRIMLDDVMANPVALLFDDILTRVVLVLLQFTGRTSPVSHIVVKIPD